MKFPCDGEECSTISFVSKQFEKCCENQSQSALHDNSILEDKNEEE